MQIDTTQTPEQLARAITNEAVAAVTGKPRRTKAEIAAAAVQRATEQAAKAKAKADAAAVKAAALEASATDAPKAKAEAKPKPTPRPVCSATKQNGQPCTARVILGEDGQPTEFCTDHRPASAHLTTDEMDWFLEQAKSVDWLVQQIGWGRVKTMAAKAEKGGGQ